MVSYIGPTALHLSPLPQLKFPNPLSAAVPVEGLRERNPNRFLPVFGDAIPPRFVFKRHSGSTTPLS